MLQVRAQWVVLAHATACVVMVAKVVNTPVRVLAKIAVVVHASGQASNFFFEGVFV